MPFNIESFIFEIEKRPAIYNIKLKEYSDKNLKEKLWIELCELFVEKWEERTPSEKREKVKELLGRWKDLRSCFKKEYDVQKTMPTATKKRRFLYYDKLLFLLPVVEEIEASNSTQSSVNEKRTEDLVTEERVNDKKKEERVNDKKNEEKEIDEDRYFLLSLLPAFKKFNDEQKYMARIEIMNTMRRVHMNQNTFNPPAGSPQPVHSSNIGLLPSTSNSQTPSVSFHPAQMVNFQITSSEVLTRHFASFFNQQQPGSSEIQQPGSSEIQQPGSSEIQQPGSSDIQPESPEPLDDKSDIKLFH